MRISPLLECWVSRVCILLAHSQETADILRVALKQTLKYALFSQSLERMVEDFAKDQKLTGEEVARIVSRVREGDMTLVLETYENDLKVCSRTSLARSSADGSLVTAQVSTRRQSSANAAYTDTEGQGEYSCQLWFFSLG